MGSLFRQGAVGLGQYICLYSFFFLFSASLHRALPPSTSLADRCMAFLSPQLQCYTQCNDGDHDTPYGAMMATTMPHMAQQPQLWHPTWRSDGNHDATHGTTMVTTTPMWHNDGDCNTHAVQQQRQQHPMQCSNSDTPWGVMTATMTVCLGSCRGCA